MCRNLYGITTEETAEAVGRPPGTVATYVTRAREKLEELARGSERATAAGERRR